MRDRGYRTPSVSIVPSNYQVQNYAAIDAPSPFVRPIAGARTVRVFPQANQLHAIPVSYTPAQVSVRPYSMAGLPTPIQGQ